MDDAACGSRLGWVVPFGSRQWNGLPKIPEEWVDIQGTSHCIFPARKLQGGSETTLFGLASGAVIWVGDRYVHRYLAGILHAHKARIHLSKLINRTLIPEISCQQQFVQNVDTKSLLFLSGKRVGQQDPRWRHRAVADLCPPGGLTRIMETNTPRRV